MWMSVNEPGLVASFAAEVPRHPPAVSALLGKLAGLQDLPEVFAVTSLGRLRFTTAASYEARSTERFEDAPSVAEGR